MAESVLYQRRDKVAVVTLDQPQRLNALSLDVRAGLRQAYAEAEGDPQVQVIILTGNGRAFCAGNDIKHLDLSGAAARQDIEDTLELYHQAERLEKIVIAAVNGYALGGGFELALGCDLILASDRAEFGTPEAGIGLVAGFAMLRLPHLVGKHRAMELLATGERITAEDALHMGLINRVTPHEALLEESLKMADKICSQAPLAVRLYKRAVNQGLDSAELRHAVEACAPLFSSEDQKEGRAAFLEKRRPVFKGL